MKRIKVNALIQPEVDKIRRLGNLTVAQDRILVLLNQDYVNDEGIMMSLYMSPRKYYETKRILYEKIEKVLSLPDEIN